MSLTYITITESFVDGTGAPLNTGVTLTPSQAVYAGGVPVVTPAQPIVAQVVGGALQGPNGGALQLLATSQAGLTLMSGTGFWFWTASVTIGKVTDTWSFQLATSPGSVELYSTKNTPVNAWALAAAPGSTTVPAGELSPAIVTLTDAATVAINAAAGNDWRLLLTSAIGATRVIGAPSNPADGEQVVLALTQPASGGPCAATWNAAFDFGTAGAPALTATASKADLLGFKYYGGSTQKWRFLGPASGFAA